MSRYFPPRFPLWPPILPKTRAMSCATFVTPLSYIHLSKDGDSIRCMPSIPAAWIRCVLFWRSSSSLYLLDCEMTLWEDHAMGLCVGWRPGRGSLQQILARLQYRWWCF
ncbi:hypothetical protein VTK56DRAFT_9167 [Thermocarpiscus australiensis]